MRRQQRFHKGRWAVDCERLRIPPTHRPPPENHATKISDLIPGLIKDMEQENQSWEEELMGEWGAVVGLQIAKNTRPGRYDRKILTIYVSNSPWLSELSRFGKPDLLKKIQARFGARKIRDLRFQLDPDKR